MKARPTPAMGDALADKGGGWEVKDRGLGNTQRLLRGPTYCWSSFRMSWEVANIPDGSHYGKLVSISQKVQKKLHCFQNWS